MASPVDDECYCASFQHAIEVIGRRWTGSILRTLVDEPRRFGEVTASIPGLSDRLLDNRLTELACEGIVERRERSEIIEYSLTPKGRDLQGVLEAVAAWAAKHADLPPEAHPGRSRTAH